MPRQNKRGSHHRGGFATSANRTPLSSLESTPGSSPVPFVGAPGMSSRPHHPHHSKPNGTSRLRSTQVQFSKGGELRPGDLLDGRRIDEILPPRDDAEIVLVGDSSVDEGSDTRELPSTMQSIRDAYEAAVYEEEEEAAAALATESSDDEYIHSNRGKKKGSKSKGKLARLEDEEMPDNWEDELDDENEESTGSAIEDYANNVVENGGSNFEPMTAAMSADVDMDMHEERKRLKREAKRVKRREQKKYQQHQSSDDHGVSATEMEGLNLEQKGQYQVISDETLIEPYRQAGRDASSTTAKKISKKLENRLRFNADDSQRNEMMEDMAISRDERKAKNREEREQAVNELSRREPVHIDDILYEIIRQQRSTEYQECIRLPPLPKMARAMMHQVCQCLDVKTRSMGQEPDRYMEIYVTPSGLTGPPFVKRKGLLISLVKRWEASVDRSGVKSLFIKEFGYGGGGGRGRGGGGGGRGRGRGRGGDDDDGGYSSGSRVKPVRMRDGDVVAAHAPEIGPENRGRAMLEKMGWNAGMGLGSGYLDPIRAPIVAKMKTSKAGL